MNIKVNRMCRLSLMLSLLIVFSYIRIEIFSFVPLTLQTFIVYLIPLVLDLKDSLFCVLTYLLMGMIGLPVFAGFQGGISYLLGPTGGFLLAFVLMVGLIGLLKKHVLIALILSTCLAYMMGMLWFSFVMKTSFLTAFQACVLPFILGDAFKIVLARQTYFFMMKK